MNSSWAEEAISQFYELKADYLDPLRREWEIIINCDLGGSPIAYAVPEEHLTFLEQKIEEQFCEFARILDQLEEAREKINA